jgi:hypothetical protein
MFDIAERGCGTKIFFYIIFFELFLFYLAESYTCNASAPIPRRYCCNTNYCNDAISSIQKSRSIFFISILIINIVLFCQ